MAGTSDGKTERKEQDMAKDQNKSRIAISMFNWGPCVIRLKINEEFQNKLLEEAKQNKEDMRGKLAGQIEKETGYSDESKKKLIPVLSQYLGVYDQAYQQWTQKPLVSLNDCFESFYIIVMIL